MRKSHKLLLVFLIASAIAVGVFIHAFNTLAGKNREQVHQELQRFLGKDATFDQLEASVWGGLGFSAQEFRIADNPRFAATPIVRAKELKLGVSLLQLLLGRIVVNSLTFQAPEFQIITDERGLLNLVRDGSPKEGIETVSLHASDATGKKNAIGELPGQSNKNEKRPD